MNSIIEKLKLKSYKEPKQFKKQLKNQFLETAVGGSQTLSFPQASFARMAFLSFALVFSIGYLGWYYIQGDSNEVQAQVTPAETWFVHRLAHIDYYQNENLHKQMNLANMEYSFDDLSESFNGDVRYTIIKTEDLETCSSALPFSKEIEEVYFEESYDADTESYSFTIELEGDFDGEIAYYYENKELHFSMDGEVSLLEEESGDIEDFPFVKDLNDEFSYECEDGAIISVDEVEGGYKVYKEESGRILLYSVTVE